MIYLSEWLPNPKGSDREGEWIELGNSGDEPVALADWQVQTKNQAFTLKDHVIPGSGFLVLPRSETRLALHNQSGELSLLREGDERVDYVSFSGSAPEGKSFARLGPGSERFLFTDPTPGAANRVNLAAHILTNDYPLGRALNAADASFDPWSIIFFSAALVAGASLFIVKQHERASHLFFRRN